MISYQWCSELDSGDRDEVLALVAAAAEYDEEAGFSRIHPGDVTSTSRDGVRVSHLPIKARKDLSARDDAPLVIVAYLHLQVDGEGLGTVQFVVHPDYRSRGVATMLVEEIGLGTTADGGWERTGAVALRCWAYSTHPASERLARRFGIPAVGRLWTLFRHLSGPFAIPLDEVAAPEGITTGDARPLGDPAVSRAIDEVLDAASLVLAQRERLADEIRLGSGNVLVATDSSGAKVGFVWSDPALSTHLELDAASVRALVLTETARGAGLGMTLLTMALGALRDAGAQIALIRIDPDDAGAVRMCRLMAFEQEGEHSCYQVGEWAEAPSFRVRPGETSDESCPTLT
ncbi:acetyltransferase [Rhodococcus sp. WB1]|uniref:acetyl-CoA--Cys-GlcN-Ins acetyltransferase mycothiol synthase n=1 Tax=Rhodococcus TaxID=1827 RepID=UPI0002D225A6|nr:MULTISPECIES: acetyl-CoA--Cys-GlcN-Ins acetyltransferase mycothiol synthase [Rhodococcus]AKE88798.1 acetyltransferase [Rhodococcus aetherivorans]ANZ26517.1 acetyltransferase [Rhodococcus sp. WB1]WFS12866.1 acetyl-CoA--Cys-GlcN-Ins acetyltransferase mycothiol synthase [Rhodococcus aetherivorans]CCW11588.1 Acetyl-CoA:Cys-GlcN-Ins acetyltransferase,mycothiol synthase MshD [Rhodococcus aetherivorans]